MYVHSSKELFLQVQVLWVLLRAEEHSLSKLTVNVSRFNLCVLMVTMLHHPVHLLLVELVDLLEDPFNVKDLGLVGLANVQV